jgi:hypothetical protein
MDLTPIKAAGDAVEKIGNAIDKNFESSEERQEALSHRHEMDMINGTWLTKNIRPLTLLLLLAYWIVVIPLMQSFGIVVDATVTKAVEMLSLAAFGFYFGGKSFEKINVIRAKSDRKQSRREKRNK